MARLVWSPLSAHLLWPESVVRLAGQDHHDGPAGAEPRIIVVVADMIVQPVAGKDQRRGKGTGLALGRRGEVDAKPSCKLAWLGGWRRAGNRWRLEYQRATVSRHEQPIVGECLKVRAVVAAGRQADLAELIGDPVAGLAIARGSSHPPAQPRVRQPVNVPGEDVSGQLRRRLRRKRPLGLWAATRWPGRSTEEGWMARPASCPPIIHPSRAAV